LNEDSIIVATTGAATVNLGTARPLMLRANGHCPNLVIAAQSTFAGAQLNWASPEVAQKLPLVMKATDEELKARDAQEIRRLR
jgi:hypothetical protein